MFYSRKSNVFSWMFCSVFTVESIFHPYSMLLLKLCIVFLSPITMFSVTSVSLPEIHSFKHIFTEEVDSKRKVIKNLELTCVIFGSPTPELLFQYNGVNIGNSSRMTKIINKLIIKDVKYPADEGSYRCVAKSIHGQVFKEEFIKIKSIGSFHPGLTITDKEYFHDVILGQELDLHCPDHTYAYPVKYLWGAISDKQKITFIKDSPNMQVTRDGSLLFSSVTREDVEYINRLGGISCILKMGDKFPKLAFSRKNGLHIAGTRNNDSAPQVIYHFPVKIYARQGESVTLTCLAKGNPRPDIKWFRNGVQIQSNDYRYGINAYLPTKLTIRNIDASIVGQFKCVASNRIGSDAKYGNLMVATPPTFSQVLPSKLKVPQKESLRLVCSADGTNPIDYKWYMNGSLLSSYHLDNVSMTIKDGILTISSVDYDDRGTYQCTANNKYGSVSSVASITIIDKSPNATTGKQNNSKEDNNNNKNNVNNGTNPSGNITKTDSDGDPLTMQHIIIISCGGAVFIILFGGGLFLCCRTKNDSKEVHFIPTPHHDLQKPLFTETDFPPPPKSLTDSDDDLSSFGGAKLNAPEFIDLMSEIRSKQCGTPTKPEHFYYDIPEDMSYASTTTPSTEL